MSNETKEKGRHRNINIAIGVLSALATISIVIIMISDRLSGFHEKSRQVEGIIVGLYSTPGAGESHSFYLIVAIDNGSEVYVDVPYTTKFKIGERILLTEFTTKKFGTKHYQLLKLLE